MVVHVKETKILENIVLNHEVLDDFLKSMVVYVDEFRENPTYENLHRLQVNTFSKITYCVYGPNFVNNLIKLIKL